VLCAPATVNASPPFAVHVHPPLETRWRDLYISWNSCFVSAEYADVPRFLAQVLTPAVLEAPASEYVLRRSLALYVHIWATVVRRQRASAAANARGWRAQLAPGDGVRPRSCWRSAKLLRAWGEHNAAEARLYEAELAAARASSFTYRVISPSWSRLPVSSNVVV